MKLPDFSNRCIGFSLVIHKPLATYRNLVRTKNAPALANRNTEVPCMATSEPCTAAKLPTVVAPANRPRSPTVRMSASAGARDAAGTRLATLAVGAARGGYGTPAVRVAIRQLMVVASDGDSPSQSRTHRVVDSCPGDSVTEKRVARADQGLPEVALHPSSALL